MIVAGSESKVLQRGVSSDITCSKCSLKGTTELTVYLYYMTVFWIPALPLGKKAVMQCTNCHQRRREKSLALEDKLEIKNVKARIPFPWKMFLVAGYFAVMFGASLFYKVYEGWNVKTIADNPELNDIYYFQRERGISMFRITDLDENSISFVEELPVFQVLDSAKSPSSQRLEYIRLTNEEIDQFLEDDAIREIKRDQGK